MQLKSYFRELETYLQEYVAGNANLMDSDTEVLRPHFEKLKQLGTFRLRLPQENGNPTANEKDFLLNDSLLAEYSGALCFLQTQYRGALSRLSDPMLTTCQKFLWGIKYVSIYHWYFCCE